MVIRHAPRQCDDTAIFQAKTLDIADDAVRVKADRQDFARDFLDELDERLTSTGYEVKQTPYGYFCEWDLSVYGESLAKVWKEIG